MGNSKHKDANVDIYYEIDKPFYYAGEWVQGNVFLAVKANLTYSALYLRLEGHEYCHWHEKHGKTDVWYTGEKETYRNENIIAKFDRGLLMGHYTFPFSFQLPPQMPGSYLEGGDTDFRIYYPLQAYLVDYNDEKKRVDYTYNITVLEPPRISQVNSVMKDSANPQVCCCADQGRTEMEVRVRNTATKTDNPLIMDVKIDNKLCKQDIKYVQVELFKHLFVQDNYGTSRDWETSKSMMKTRPVRAGGEDTIEIQMLAPVESSTAIGTIVANYYTVKVQSNVSGCICCCGHNHPTLEKEVYIQAANPTYEDKPKMNPPAGWNPIVAPKLVFNTGAKFNYERNPKLVAMNRAI